MSLADDSSLIMIIGNEVNTYLLYVPLDKISLIDVRRSSFYLPRSAPAYDIYILQSVHYARSCFDCENFDDREKLSISKLLSQGYRRAKFAAALRHLRNLESVLKVHLQSNFNSSNTFGTMKISSRQG